MAFGHAHVSKRLTRGAKIRITVRLTRAFRLLQNRKSAKKCRLKKKAEFSVLKGDVDAVSHENA